MGMGKRKDRAKSFKQKTARTLDGELRGGGLLARGPVEFQQTVECIKESESVRLKIGGRVKLVDMRDGIDVFSKTICVGHVISSRVEELRASYRLESSQARSIEGEILEVPEFGQTFVVLIKHK